MRVDRRSSSSSRTESTPSLRAEIGALPRGRGILGVLIREATPLRLHDLADDERSVGFPPGHPPMRSFLGVPILLRGVAYGNLYLTEKLDGEDFTEEDEELVTLLAGQAAVAIENARLYEASTRWSRQLQSLNEVGNALATETDLDDCSTSSFAACASWSVRASSRSPCRAGATSCGSPQSPARNELLGTTLSRSESKSGAVLERRRSERIDSVIDDPEVHQEVTRRLAVRTGMWVPLIAHDRVIGVLEIHDKEGPDARFSDDDLRLAETFAERAAVAVELSQRVARDAVAPRRAGAGARASAPRARAPRRDRPGADLDHARAQAARRRARRRTRARRARRAARAGRERAARRTPPRGRAPPGRARRLRPRGRRSSG